MYIMNWKLLFTTLAAALSLASCVSTPASRIQKNPALFNSLPPSQKTLVEAGQIAEGMSPPAVFLAWGDPSAVAEGNLNGKSATRWIYSSLQPVYTPPPSFWAGPYCEAPIGDRGSTVPITRITMTSPTSRWIPATCCSSTAR